MRNYRSKHEIYEQFEKWRDVQIQELNGQIRELDDRLNELVKKRDELEEMSAAEYESIRREYYADIAEDR